jgi:hypothetical protein
MVGLSEGFRGFAPFGDGYRGMQRLLSNFIKGKGHQTPGETISSSPDGSGERILLLFEYETLPKSLKPVRPAHYRRAHSPPFIGF